MEPKIIDNEKEFPIKLEIRVKNAQLVGARESLGLTQEQAALCIGISKGMYVQYERLGRYPSDNHQEKICEFYNDNGIYMNMKEVFPPELNKFKIKGAHKEIRYISLENLVLLSPKQIEKELPAYEPDQERYLEIDELNEKLNKLLGTLSIREQSIIKMVFNLDVDKNYTLEGIGKEFYISKERVRQITEVALQKLRNPIRQYLSGFDE